MMKLVIVEDEDIIREGLISYVDWESLGYEVAGEAMNGKEGLEVIRREQPDVVLTDIRMPVMDGLDMLRTLREEGNETAAVILSGYEDFEYARSALKLGVSEYILKPLNISNLEEVMEKICRKYEEKRERQEEFSRLKNLEDYNRQQGRLHTITCILQEQKLPEDGIEVQEELEELYYFVVITARDRFSLLENSYDYLQLSEEDRSFGQKVAAVLPKEDNLLMLRVNMGERVLCRWHREKETLQKQLEEMTEILSREWKGEFPLSVSKSAIGSGLKGLEGVYRRARKKQKEVYLKELSDIVRVEKDEQNTFRYMSYNASGLFAEVKTGTYEAIDRELACFEQELESHKVVSHMHVLLLVTNLYGELMKLPEELSSSPEEILGDPMEYYKKVVTNTDRREILRHLKEVCYRFNDFFQTLNQGKFDSILTRALEFMQKEYRNPTLQIKDVAKAAYVSNSYLSIIIKQGTGKTFVEYLTELRMEKAKRLLEETELKSYEIAELCGFSTPTYFSTVFKSAYGMSPSMYKKTYKNN